MAAKLATVDEHILAYAEGSGAIPEGSISLLQGQRTTAVWRDAIRLRIPLTVLHH